MTALELRDKHPEVWVALVGLTRYLACRPPEGWAEDAVTDGAFAPLYDAIIAAARAEASAGLVDRLAAIYREGYTEAAWVARICDEALDRSGRLLGLVRDAAALPASPPASGSAEVER